MVKIPRRALLGSALGIVAFLELMSLVPGSISHTIQNRFDLNAEANIPTWYSGTLLSTIALVALCLHLRDGGAKERRFWLIFALLSLDEIARLHEILDSPAIRIEWLYVYGMEALNYFFPILDLWFHVSVMVEEGLEMCGASGALVGCLCAVGWLA